MLKFQQTARLVRSLNEGDKDVDIMQSILEGLIEHIDALRQTQQLTVNNINSILEYMKLNQNNAQMNMGSVIDTDSSQSLSNSESISRRSKSPSAKSTSHAEPTSP
jgi:hypothetical protein